jgi:Spy/CpxP family protein refolding chaperone
VSAAAAASVAAGRGQRYSRLLIAVLVISLVLNLCFVAGAAWTRLHAPPGGRNLVERYQEIASELDLNAQQRAAFDQYIAAMRGRADQMLQDTEPLMGAAWDELAKPQPDEAKVTQLFDQAGDKRRGFQRDATVQTMALLATLSPAQRAKFVALMRERRAAWRRAQSH